MSDSNELEIEISATDGAAAVVFVRGEVDMANAHEISAVVSVLAGWAETSRVVVDLSAVAFMDSSGIAALMACHRDLHAAGLGFEVVGARGAPLQVLELTGVLGYLSPQAGGATTYRPAPVGQDRTHPSAGSLRTARREARP